MEAISTGCSKLAEEDSEDSAATKRKPKRLLLDDLHGSEEAEDYGADSAAIEIRTYLTEKVVKRLVDALAWWKVNADQFPRLGNLAKKYLAIPATRSKGF